MNNERKELLSYAVAVLVLTTLLAVCFPCKSGEEANLEIDQRATAGYYFSPLLGFEGLRGTSQRIARAILKARDNKGDSGNFPCKMRSSRNLRREFSR